MQVWPGGRRFWPRHLKTVVGRGHPVQVNIHLEQGRLDLSAQRSSVI